MSFGFSSADLPILLALSSKVQKRLVGTPSQFKGISDRVRSLSVVLQDVGAISSVSAHGKKRRKDLERIAVSCRDTLIDLEKSLDDSSELVSRHWDLSKNPKEVDRRIVWKPEDIRSFQDRITSDVEHLDAYLRLLSNNDNIESKDNNNQVPLHWAARTGDTTTVKQLLNAGADIDLRDNHNRTPLHWTSENGHTAMVEQLLNAGADINLRDDGSQTPLHLAARFGNTAIVKQLLNAGADIDSKDNDNRTPLHWAAEYGRRAVVEQLLSAGADIDSKDKRTLLQWLDPNWGENADFNVISKSSGHSEEDNDPKSPKRALVAEFLTSGQPFSINQEDPQELLSSTAAPDALRAAIDRLDVQAVTDLLTQAFNDIARDEMNWLPELVEMGYDYSDIAQLLVDEKKESPWIFIEPPETSGSVVIADHHLAYCVHEGGHEVTFPSNLIAKEEDIHHIDESLHSDLPDLDSIKQTIAASCGLAGVIPVARDRQEWIGSLTFDNDDHAVASVTYELDLSHPTSTIQDYLLRIQAALERLVNIVSWLQQNKLSCNSFTMLQMSAKVGQVELVQIPFALISTFFGKVSCLQSSERDMQIFDSALKIAHEILDIVYGVERQGATTFLLNTMDLENARRITIHNCALATQSLCLGLLSYSNAHTGPIQPFFLSLALKTVKVLGIETCPSTKQRLSAELVELTCFGQMIRKAVIVFACTEMPSYTQTYDLLASPEDLVDTWGPGRFVVDPSSTKIDRLYAIEIGGGIIRPTAEDATRFHWEKGSLDSEASRTQFGSRTKIIIGATNFNQLCPLDQSRSWSICTNLMENLGTRPDYWQLVEMQAGSQAGQFVTLQFNGTWIKQDGITLKDRQLNAIPDTVYLSFLESLWGLQVSLCTGVARRVPVREMLADVMVAYVEKRLPVPPLWNDLLNDHKIVDSFQEPGLAAWFQNLSPVLQTLVVRIVRYILGVLGDTGYNEQTDELIIAWPFPLDPFRCFRIPCSKDQHLWARALADSETCATFAYITPKCWDVPNGQECQQSCVATWRNRVVSLDTAVCQHKCNKDPHDQALTWMLKPSTTYWIGKPGSDLKAKVLESTTHLDTRLSITRSLIPENLRRRISRLQGIPTYRIREKQQSGELNAMPVLILSAPKPNS